jgi:uncharacterized repeat protein (TIGR01451 family)
LVPAADGTVRVQWTASDADSDDLLFTVLYSPDGGATWTAISVEEPHLFADVLPSHKRTGHRVKVLATDGGRSGEAVGSFDLDVTEEADLSITKIGDPNPVAAGELLTYNFIVSNHGPSPATSVMVIDDLPPNVAFQPEPSISDCHESEGRVTCSAGDLDVGQSVPLTMAVRVSETAAGTISNSVEVAGNEPDPDPSNNRAVEDTEVAPAPPSRPVAWLPPVTNRDDFVLQDGTALPLNFQLVGIDGLAFTEPVGLYLIVTGPGLNGDGVRFDPGSGRGYLSFDPEDLTYTAVFHTRDYALVDAATYTATVHDGSTGVPIGSIDFSVSTKKGTGRGKGP